jgi:polysaccharide biosynthesis transport protein
VNDHQPLAQPLTIRNYLEVVSRRKLTILMSVLIGLGIGLVATTAAGPRYSTSAKVLIGIGHPPKNSNQRVAPDRLAETQAGLANSTAIAGRVLAGTQIDDMSAEEFLSASSVKSNPENDILTFSVSDEDPNRARMLTAQFAAEFIKARRGIDGGRYVRQVGDAFVVAAPGVPKQTGPQIARNVILGLMLGLFAGLLAAFLREGLDTRVRSGVEILARLHLPLLGRLPKLDRSRLRALVDRALGRPKRNHVLMLADPDGRHSEPFRMLRSNLDFFNMEHNARSIMITSALQREGKTTTAANLGVALARTGRRVILVDADLRRSSLQQLFGLHRLRGLVDAVYGVADLEELLVTVPMDAPVELAGVNGNGHGGHDEPEPLLRVLPAGAPPHSVGEFFASPGLAATLENLKDRADVVIIDGPPLLGTGDGLAAAANVDAIALVARIDEIHEPALDDLTLVLATCRSRKLGLIITGLDVERSYSADYGAGTPRGPVPSTESLPLDAGA